MYDCTFLCAIALKALRLMSKMRDGISPACAPSHNKVPPLASSIHAQLSSPRARHLQPLPIDHDADADALHDQSSTAIAIVHGRVLLHAP